MLSDINNGVYKHCLEKIHYIKIIIKLSLAFSTFGQHYNMANTVYRALCSKQGVISETPRKRFHCHFLLVQRVLYLFLFSLFAPVFLNW